MQVISKVRIYRVAVGCVITVSFFLGSLEVAIAGQITCDCALRAKAEAVVGNAQFNPQSGESPQAMIRKSAELAERAVRACRSRLGAFKQYNVVPQKTNENDIVVVPGSCHLNEG